MSAPRADHRTMIAFVVGGVQFVNVFNVASINLAIDQVEHQLHFGAGLLPWIVSVYALAFGAVVLVGGKLADVLGTRTTLPSGLLIMALASGLAATASSSTLFLAGRSLEGVGAALAVASAMEIISRTADPASRRKSLVAFVTAAGIGFGLGFLLGGVLVADVGWRWLIALTAPMALTVLAVALSCLPKADAVRDRLNLVGAVAVVVATLALLFGATELSHADRQVPVAVASLVLAAVLFAVAWVSETRTRYPLIPRPLWTQPGVGPVLVAGALLFGSWLSTVLYLTLMLERVLHYTPTETGAALSILGFGTFVSARLAARPLARGHEVRLVLGGLAVQAVATTLFVVLNSELNYLVIGPMLFVATCGQTLAWMAVSGIVLSSARPGRNGIASGVLNAFLQIGGGLVVCVISLVVGTAYSAPASGANPSGYRLGFVVSGGLLTLGLILVAISRLRVPALSMSSASPQILDSQLE